MVIENFHASYGVDPEKCKNLEESYGEICVLCNKCGRWDNRNREEEEKKVKEAIEREFKKPISCFPFISPDGLFEEEESDDKR